MDDNTSQQKKNEKTYPLHNAIQYRSMIKIKTLLPKTKNVNEKNDEGYPIFVLACKQEQNDEMLEILLNHDKIDPTLTNNDKFNALHILAFKGNLFWIKKLLNKFPDFPIDDVNNDMNTPLIMAAKMNHPEVIKYLHSKGANINHQNYKKYTALLYAANNDYVESTQELLRLGAEVNCRDGYECTPLIKAASWGFKDVCEILLRNGANVNDTNNIRETALTGAIMRKRDNVLKLLLEHGANPNHVISRWNKQEFTPLSGACFNRNKIILELLIEYGADVNFPGSFSLALTTCLKKDFRDGVVSLLNANVNVTAIKTAINFAKKYQLNDMIALLEDHLNFES